MVETDVCIIGAGPSGVSTSIMLSKHKIKHLIVDKAVFPRDKTCGDGLILYAYKALKQLDEQLFEDFKKHPKIIHSKKIKLHINDTTNIQFKETKERDMVISYAKRIDFDNFLVEHLSPEYTDKEFGNGVKSIKEVEGGILVTLKNGRQIKSKFIVGADGANSIVSRKLAKNKVDKNLSSTFISAYFTGVKNLQAENEAEIRIHYKEMPLFFYVFPLSDGTVNVSLGGKTKDLLDKDINLIDEVEEIIKHHPKVFNKFINSKNDSGWRGWTIPYGFKNQKVSGNRFALVGDAAGLANAFYKEGVGTGMMSGIICANHIKSCFSENDFSLQKMKDYDSALEKEFGKLLDFSKKSLRISKYRRLFLWIVKLSKRIVESRAPKMILRRSY